MSARLKTTERLLLLLVLTLIFTFYILAKLTGFRELEQSKRLFPQPLISIEIRGAVKKPGTYAVPQGTILSAVVEKARPKPLADLSGYAPEQIMNESCSIELPYLKEISVEVSGCVKKNIRLTVEAGSRLCDLKSRIELSEDADRTFLRRKRLLKNNEVISVPAQKEKCSNSFVISIL